MSKKSVISLHCGQAGSQIGWELWKLYCDEHDITFDGKRNIDPETIGADIDNFKTFFYESSSGHYVPKCIFADSESSVMDSLRTSEIGQMFHNMSMINGQQDCRNVMGLAFYDEFCPEVHQGLRKAIRRMTEQCDVLSGYMHFLSSCGGSGPGFTCRALEQIRDLAPKSINHSHVLLPSPTISQNPMETYNAITYLGLIRYDNLFMNINTIFDNEALYRQSIHLSGNRKFIPTYSNLNQLIAISLSSATASIRFDGQLNVDMEDFQVNLVPYPTMHHLFHTFAPLHNDRRKDKIRLVDLTLQAFKPEAHCVSVNCLADCNKWPVEEEADTFQSPVWAADAEDEKDRREQQGKKTHEHCYAYKHGFIGCALMYRGDALPVKVNQAVRTLKEEYDPYFVSWVPNGFKIGINTPPLIHPKDSPYKNTSRSLTAIINSSAILEKFKHICRDYRLMKDRGGYDLWFSHGKFQKEIVDNCKNGLIDLINQYENAIFRNMEAPDMRDAMAARPEKIGEYKTLV